MTSRSQLLEAHAHLTAAIRAGEPWEISYTDSPATFKRLVQEEARLQASATDYLLGLAERAVSLVNWSEAKLQPIMASAVPPESDDVWKAERTLLAAALSAHVLELTVIGANAGEYLYSRPLNITSLDEFILNAADKYTAELVSDVTATTRRYVQKAIKRSIAQGEDVTAAIERIRKRIANPVRAELIAQTESVTAYQTGLDHFGLETGALSSTWDSLLGACVLCGHVHGTTVKIGHFFTLPNGKQVKYPPGHGRCRCGRTLNTQNSH